MQCGEWFRPDAPGGPGEGPWIPEGWPWSSLLCAAKGWTACSLSGWSPWWDGPVLLCIVLCQDPWPLGPVARPVPCHSACSLRTCSDAILGSPAYYFLPRLHAMVWVLLHDGGLPPPAWIRALLAQTLAISLYFSGCFKAPDMPGCALTRRWGRQKRWQWCLTTCSPTIYQSRRNRLSPLRVQRLSRIHLTLDMLNERSKKFRKPFSLTITSFPSENLVTDPDKI